MEKRKKARETQREMIGELRKLASAQRGRGRGRGGWRGGHSYFSGGDWGGERVDVREMRRQETLEKARMDQQIRMRVRELLLRACVVILWCMCRRTTLQCHTHLLPWLLDHLPCCR